MRSEADLAVLMSLPWAFALTEFVDPTGARCQIATHPALPELRFIDAITPSYGDALKDTVHRILVDRLVNHRPLPSADEVAGIVPAASIAGAGVLGLLAGTIVNGDGSIHRFASVPTGA